MLFLTATREVAFSPLDLVHACSLIKSSSYIAIVSGHVLQQRWLPGIQLVYKHFLLVVCT